MYIRRDKSNLHFGRQRRRRGSRLLLVIWTVTMLLAVGVLMRFNTVQRWVLAGVGTNATPTLDAITRAQLGERAYLAGNLETAIAHYREAALQQPDNINILFEYGRVLVYRNYAGRSFFYHAEEALDVAQRAVEVAPDNAQANALLCLALVTNGRAEEAISAGLNASQLAPDYAEARAFLSLAYYYAGRPSQALEAADQAVKLNPDSVDARRALALALAYVGQFNASVQQYERAIQIHPRLDVLYFELAQYYKGLNNYDAAIAAFDQVLAMEPDNVKAYVRKCETYFTMREDQMAQEACEQAIQLDPEYPEAYRQLGMVRYTRKNYEGAIESFEVCSTLQTQQGVPLIDQEIQCYYVRGLAHTLLARCDEAWPVLQTALQMNPSEHIKGLINQGLMSCVNYGDFSIDQVPTAIPPTPVPPEPIGVF